MESNGAAWLIFLFLWPPRKMAVAVQAPLFWLEEWRAPIFMRASWLSWWCENIEMCISPSSWCRWFWQWQLLLFACWFRDCRRIRYVVAGNNMATTPADRAIQVFTMYHKICPTFHMAHVSANKPQNSFSTAKKFAAHWAHIS